MTNLYGKHFDQAAFISECASVEVPCGHRWEVRQCGCNVVAGGRIVREEERGQNLKYVPLRNPGGLTFWFL